MIIVTNDGHLLWKILDRLIDDMGIVREKAKLINSDYYLLLNEKILIN